MSRRKVIGAGLLGLLVMFADGCLTPETKDTPTPGDPCSPEQVVDRSAAEVTACAEAQAAVSSAQMVAWARATLGQRHEPPVPLLRGLAGVVGEAPSRSELTGLALAVGEALTRVGELDAAEQMFTRLLLANAQSADPIAGRITAAVHLELADVAAARKDLPTRCKHIEEALNIDITLHAPVSAYFVAGCHAVRSASEGRTGPLSLCRSLAASEHLEQARICVELLDLYVSEESLTIDIDELILEVHGRLGYRSIPGLRVLAARRTRLQWFTRNLDGCVDEGWERNDQFGAEGVYLAMSNDPTLTSEARRCYIKLAASICMTLLRYDDCLVPESLVTFVREPTSSDERNRFRDFVIHVRGEKHATYEKLRREGCNARHTETLFYYHYALSELLLRHPDLVARGFAITDPTFQVCSMRDMYRRTFKQELSVGDEPAGASKISCENFKAFRCTGA